MAKKDNRYIITRSNYTLRDKHKQLKNGKSIYERDYMITTNLGGWDSGSIPNGEGNFKFTNNYNKNTTRNVRNGSWLVKDDCTGGTESCTTWTLSDLGSEDILKDESKIVIKPSKATLLDFAYYGSCIELIKSSIREIINKFPAELFVTNQPYEYLDGSGYTPLGTGVFPNPVEVANPFNINITSKTVSVKEKESPEYNALRYFAESYSKYQTIDADGTMHCVSGWEVTLKKKKCFKNGDLIGVVAIKKLDGANIPIYCYNYENKIIFITDKTFFGTHIRPLDSVIEDVYNKELSAFEQFLLNRTSTPIFSVNIDTPRETEYGITVHREKYSWPTQHGWNLDIETVDYSKYTNQLLNVARFYDEHYTDNLWRNITHEAIKNMDITFSNPQKDEDADDYILGTGNIHGLLLSYGRQFDEIKLAIDNIKSCNTITYDENNNIPDYFLSDTLELSGWEVSNAIKTLDSSTTISNLYSGEKREYDLADTNAIFMRNLKINSRDIFSRKGTKYAIEMVMSLFGLSSYEFGKNYYNCLPETYKIAKSGMPQLWDDLSDEDKSNFYDYRLDEYVAVAKNLPSDVVPADDTLLIEEINSNIKETSDSPEALPGLPVKMVYIDVQTESGETETYKYLIPWFDEDNVYYDENGLRTSSYDGGTYFQMYGGWVKTEKTDINEYDETLKYLNVLGTIGELSELLYSDVREGDIYYVSDISDYENYYTVPAGVTPSHYFYLKNREKSYTYGDYVSDEDGWQIIPETYVENKQGHGIEVWHLESIIDAYYGNNPHVGYGNYDDGNKFIERLAHVFSGAIDEGLFNDSIYTCDNGEIPEYVVNAGFNVEKDVVDNVKCWFFTDNAKQAKLLPLTTHYTEITDTQGDTYEIKDGYEESTASQVVNVGQTAYNNNEVFMDTKLNAFNLETQETPSNDEAAANSIINTKNVTIEFNKLKYNNDEFQKYLHEVILPYVKQVIPSTTILTIKYIGGDEFDVCQSAPVITGVSD